MNSSHSDSHSQSSASQSHRKRNAGGRFEPGARARAIAEGKTHYETGVACGYGHIAPRLVSTRSCTECNRLDAAARRARKRKPRLQRERRAVRREADKVAAALERNARLSEGR